MASHSSQDIYAETLAVFVRNEHQYEPLTTPEVADALDAKRRTVYKRLQKLVDRGQLKTKPTGSNSRVWWRPPENPSTSTDSGGGTGRGSSTKHDPSDERRVQTAEDPQVETAQSAAGEQMSVDYNEIFQTIPAGVTLQDPADGTLIDVNQQYCEMLGYTREELLTIGFEAVHADVPPYTSDRAKQYIQQATTDGPQTFEWLDETKDGEQLPVEVHLQRTTLDGDDRILAVVRDLTERKEQERELRETNRQLQAVLDTVEAAIFIKDTGGRYQLLNGECKEMFQLDSGVDVVGLTDYDLFPEDVAEQYRADDKRVLERGETVEIEEEVPTAHGTQINLTLKSPLYDTDGEPAGVCAVSTDITERKERERELQQQRDQLSVLNNLNDVVREITDAIVNESGREEIEQAVCNRLADSDSYRFAWICGVDSDRQLEPRAEAGIDGYLDEISLSTDPDDPTGQGPTGKAVRTQEIQRTQHALTDPSFEPWHEHARKYGYRSSVAIPLIHEGALYGVLGIYSERPDAFAKKEREVIGQLGEVIGHAIAAVDQKRALMSDEVIELKIRIQKMLKSQHITEITDGTFTMERMIPLDDGDYLMYGTATVDPTEVLHELGEQFHAWKSFNVIEKTDGGFQFEQYLSDPPLASIVTAHGGYFADGWIEDGAYSATIHLPPGADVRRLLTTIGEAYPAAETISQQQISREEPSPQQLLRTLSEKLTERQQAALEAGYYGGFFEWPRDQSGEEIADSLGIGASTFHQHVRKAEKKLLDIVFAEP